MMDDLQALVAEMQREAEEHTATCTARTCPRCDRKPCDDCGVTTKHDHERCDGCAAKHSRQQMLERWHRIVPKAHHGAHLSADWLVELVPASVIAALPDDPGRVTFTGPAGTGKTSLAVAMLRREFGRGASCAYAKAYELGTARAHHRLGDGEAPAVQRAMSVDALVIDELGSEQGHHSATLAEIIHARHADCRTTLVTTGLDSAALVARYGDGIRRRLSEGAHAVALARGGRR